MATTPLANIESPFPEILEAPRALVDVAAIPIEPLSDTVASGSSGPVGYSV